MNNNYQIVINWSNEGHTFLAHVPQLSGCIADGNSFAEAIENVQVIIDQVIVEELFRSVMLPANTAFLTGTNFFEA